MFFKILRLIFVAVLLSLTVVWVNAQTNTPDGSPGGKEDFPNGIKESLAKNRIEREKKDYEELLQNGEEALKLSESLEKNFAESQKLSAEDQKKLDRLEKLAKKIRRELGANDSDDTADEKPSSMLDAFKFLQDSTGKLVDELKKTTRYSVSVVAIQSSNTFLKIVKFIRFGKN
jgi:hypothetical protein